MKKEIFVVGHQGMKSNELASLTQAAKGRGIILVTQKDEIKSDLEALKRQKLSDHEATLITNTRLIDNTFFPKAKHEPKGHERKYKFHR